MLEDENCGGSGCGMMHGCPDRKYDSNKSDCKECEKDADQAQEDCRKELFGIWKDYV